jgi:Ca2+-binding EF-hand superfamily protein
MLVASIKSMNQLFAVLCVVSLTATHASSQEKAAERILSLYRTNAPELFQNKGFMSLLPTMFQLQFKTLDKNGDGLSKAEIKALSVPTNADFESSAIRSRLDFDADGDSVVTAEEIGQVFDQKLSKRKKSSAVSSERRARIDALRREKVISDIMSADANADGRVEGSELKTVTDKDGKIARVLAERTIMAEALMLGDANDDGLVTIQEFSDVLLELANQTSPSIVRDTKIKHTSAFRDGCPAIAVALGSQLIMLGTYEGASISSVSVTGQDHETMAATVDVERGAAPITLVITSHQSMIWQFIGDTQRIARVYLHSAQTNPADGLTAVGTTGLPKDKVVFLSKPDCLPYFHETGSRSARLASEELSALSDGAVVTAIGRYTTDLVTIPSGKFVKRSSSFDEIKAAVAAFDSTAATVENRADVIPPLAELALRFSPGGLKTISLKEVVSATRAEKFESLPQEAGLLQLVMNGSLAARSKNGFDVTFDILRKIRVPAGLAGAHHVRFVLQPGVPTPIGDLGHSCVVRPEDESALNRAASTC